MLKIIFSEINVIVLKTKEISRSTIPSSFKLVDESPDEDSFSEESKTSKTWTRVIPMKVSEQPTIAALVSFLLRKILEKMAVVIMTPPLEICHTDPEIRFNDM